MNTIDDLTIEAAKHVGAEFSQNGGEQSIHFSPYALTRFSAIIAQRALEEGYLRGQKAGVSKVRGMVSLTWYKTQEELAKAIDKVLEELK